MYDETILDKMDLPKSNHNEELEIISENKLKPLFDTKKFLFCKKEERDKGIDLTFEIIRGNHTGFRFVVQLKASETKEPNNTDGSYSQTIYTSNINYLLNNNCPAYYIFHCSKTDTFYYESIIDVLKTLDKKDINWGTQPSHSIRFSKLLLQDGFNEMYKTAISNGLINRQLKEKSAQIASSLNPHDKIIIDADLNITDDAKIRTLIETIGFQLINEGKWKEIIQVHKKATGSIGDASALYNLILGVANYYSGNLWESISLFKKSTLLKHQLDKGLQDYLFYFDITVKHSIQYFTPNEYNEKIQTLTESKTVGLYVKLENAKIKYFNQTTENPNDNFTQYVNTIEEIINNPNANAELKLTAKCELILFKGLKNNTDFVSGIARINALDEIVGIVVEERITTAKKFIEQNENWYKNVELVLNEAQKTNNKFAYFTALLNKVKVLYQFDVFTKNVYVVKEIPGYPKQEQTNSKEKFEQLLLQVGLASNYFSAIGHVENTIVASATMFEILHYSGDMFNAERVMKELEGLIETLDLVEQKKRLNNLKNGGTTHETFKNWVNEIFNKTDSINEEYKNLRDEMIKMDEEDRNKVSGKNDDLLTIELFPIQHFQFPKSKKEVVYQILNVTDEARLNYSNLFEFVIPVANIFNNPITEEGYSNGNLADKGIENWRNVYKVRKAFFDNNFRRVEINIGQ